MKQESRFVAVLGQWKVPLIVVVVGGAVLYGLTRLPGSSRDSDPAEPPVANVSVMTVPQLRFADTLTLKGTVEPWATIRLSAEIAGKVVAVRAVEGELLKPGQELIFLESDLLEPTHTQAAAQAERDQREVARRMEANNKGVVTPAEVDRATAQAKISRAAEIYVAAQLRRTVISAPDRVHDLELSDGQLGLLNALPVEIGASVAPGDEVAEIVVRSTVKVVVDVPERDVGFFAEGQSVSVEMAVPRNRRRAAEEEVVGEDGRLSFVRRRGTIHYINDTADPKTRTFRLEISIPNPDGRIRTGIIVKAHLVRQILRNVVMVPLETVIPLPEAGTYEVYVENSGKAQQRRVRLGLLREGWVQVLPARGDGWGVRAGEQLIVKGQRLVGDGQTVAVQPDPSPPAMPDFMEVAAPATRPAGTVVPETGGGA